MAQADTHREGIFAVQTLSEVSEAPLRWVWPGRIPLGKVSLLSGDPDLGKSFVTLDVAARVSTGAEWPDGEAACEPGEVLLLAAEDDAADTILPRMKAHGADLRRIHLIRRVLPEGEREGEREGSLFAGRPPALYEDIEPLAELLRARGGFRLVVIDPITAYLGDLDANRNNDARAVLDRLAVLAEECSVAVLLVAHLRKSAGAVPAVYRTLGSIAFTAHARAVWTAVRDPHDGARRVLVPVKMNLVRRPLGMAYRIAEPGVVEWEPEPVAVEADERGENAYTETDGKDRFKRAKRWLHTLLLEGPKPSNDVKLLAREAGISWECLWEAKKALNARATRDGERWYWKLPWEMMMLIPEEDTGSLIDDLSGEQLVRLARGMGVVK